MKKKEKALTENMVPDVRCESQPHQGALCCLISLGLLLFLNRKTDKPINPRKKRPKQHKARRQNKKKEEIFT
jgi:hypothetical protein